MHLRLYTLSYSSFKIMSDQMLNLYIYIKLIYSDNVSRMSYGVPDLDKRMKKTPKEAHSHAARAKSKRGVGPTKVMRCSGPQKPIARAATQATSTKQNYTTESAILQIFLVRSLDHTLTWER